MTRLRTKYILRTHTGLNKTRSIGDKLWTAGTLLRRSGTRFRLTQLQSTELTELNRTQVYQTRIDQANRTDWRSCGHTIVVCTLATLVALVMWARGKQVTLVVPFALVLLITLFMTNNGNIFAEFALFNSFYAKQHSFENYWIDSKFIELRILLKWIAFYVSFNYSGLSCSGCKCNGSSETDSETEWERMRVWPKSVWYTTGVCIDAQQPTLSALDCHFDAQKL